jgi:tetratricopeptide (TPR) repeat protein
VAASTAPRRRLPGVTVRPGSVKAAREAAGLSLAQLVKGDLTRGAIHMIEIGRAKPSLPVLELISARTGLPLSAFASDDDILRARGLSTEEVDTRLASIERLYEQDQYLESLEVAEAALKQVVSLTAEYEARYWIARSSVMIGDAERALREIAVCIDHYKNVGDQHRLAECYDCKASALYVAQDERAEPTFFEALKVLDGMQPDPFTTRSRILAHLGSLYVETHNYDKAVVTLERAVATAQGILDLGRVGLLYDNLGLAYSELGEPRKALEYAHKAVALHRARQDHLALANAENNLGFVLLRRGERVAARAHVDNSLQLYEELGVQHRKAHVLLSIAELDLEDGHFDRAQSRADEAIKLASDLEETLNVAVGWQLLARLAEATANRRKADRLFEKAIGLLEGLQARDRLVDCYREYALVLQRRGNDKASNGFFEKALDVSRGVRRVDQESRSSSDLSA